MNTPPPQRPPNDRHSAVSSGVTPPDSASAKPGQPPVSYPANAASQTPYAHHPAGQPAPQQPVYQVVAPPPPPKDLDINDVVKKLTAPLFGAVGSIAALYQFIQLYRGDRETVTLITASLGYFTLWIALGYIAFSMRSMPTDYSRKVPRYAPYHLVARGGMAALLVISFIGLLGFNLYRSGYRLVMGESGRPSLGRTAAGLVSPATETPAATEAATTEPVTSPQATEPGAALVNTPTALAATPINTLAPTLGPTLPVTAPTLVPTSVSVALAGQVLYEWDASTGWDCWTIPMSADKKARPFGSLLMAPREKGLYFMVNFANTPNNQGRVMYTPDDNCPALPIPEGAVLNANLRLVTGETAKFCQSGSEDNHQDRLLEDPLDVNVRFFLLTPGRHEVISSQPKEPIDPQESLFLQTLGWEEAALDPEQEYDGLGLLFETQQRKKLPEGGMCFLIDRIWVEQN